MPRSQEQRPRFFEGQYLGADDLTAAVAYNRLQNARHGLGAHTWGIASGLQLKETGLPGGKVDVYVMPGYAWDGFGRPIVVLAPYKIPAELFRPYVYDPALDNGTPTGRLIEVWLRYDETATQNVRPGFEVCDVADQRSRVQETFRLEVGARPGHLDRHDRITVAGNVVDAQEAAQKLDPQTPPVALYDESVPYQSFPAEGERAYWLLPLGTARWLPNSNANQPGNFVPRNAQDLAKSRSLRRYIGVVAESVQAADGMLRLRDRTKDYSQVQSNDLVWVEGSLRVEGDVRLFGGRLDFRSTDGQDFAVPLHIRRTGDPGPGARALQISLGPDTQSNNRLAVGPLKTDDTLDEKFVVLSGGNVGIGTLTPGYKLDVVGDLRISGIARKPGGGPWTDSSDLRLKKNVESLTGALSKLLQLRGVRFEWREPEKMGNLTGTQMGLVAQEVTAVFPEWISTSPDGYQEITIRGFEALTVEALRELKAEIESLKARLPEMDTQTKETPQ